MDTLTKERFKKNSINYLVGVSMTYLLVGPWLVDHFMNQMNEIFKLHMDCLFVLICTGELPTSARLTM